MYFITFEGPEGSGKTTQMAGVAAWFEERGYTTLRTREPGGTPISDEIRAIIMGMGNRALVPGAEFLLFSAARAQHVAERIRPALVAGTVVLCDRFADSSMAYQGYGHGLPLEELRRITDFATGGLRRPDAAPRCGGRGGAGAAAGRGGGGGGVEPAR